MPCSRLYRRNPCRLLHLLIELTLPLESPGWAKDEELVWVNRRCRRPAVAAATAF